MNINTERYVKLFKNGRNQAIRIPVEFELEGTEAIIRRGKNCLIIESVLPRTLSALLASWTPLQHNGLSKIEDSLPEIVEF